MNILITICGRGGSKGIPGKNTRLLNGKPLIAYSIEHARQFAKHHPADLALSTDSGEIKNVAAQYGLVTDYTRPAELANDSAGKVAVIHHLVEYEQLKNNKKYDFVMDLDICSPLRCIEDLLEGFKLIRDDAQAYNLFSVSNPFRNPYFSIVEKKENGYFSIVKASGDIIMSRQSAPEVFDMNGSFYIYKKLFFDVGKKSAVTERSMIYLMPHTCFDLDHRIEFEFLEFLIRERKLDFTI